MIYKVKVNKPVKVVTILTGKIKDTKLIADKAVTSVNGNDFVDTRSLLKSYKGEELKDCVLIEHGEEFDAIYDIHGRDII